MYKKLSILLFILTFHLLSDLNAQHQCFYIDAFANQIMVKKYGQPEWKLITKRSEAKSVRLNINDSVKVDKHLAIKDNLNAIKIAHNGLWTVGQVVNNKAFNMKNFYLYDEGSTERTSGCKLNAPSVYFLINDEFRENLECGQILSSISLWNNSDKLLYAYVLWLNDPQKDRELHKLKFKDSVCELNPLSCSLFEFNNGGVIIDYNKNPSRVYIVYSDSKIFLDGYSFKFKTIDEAIEQLKKKGFKCFNRTVNYE